MLYQIIRTSVSCGFCLVLLLMPLVSKASHIVGGELNYSCLGNDEYEVTLTVYRDCFFGLADFDDPAALGIFNSAGQLLDSLMLRKMSVDTLIPLLTDTCLFVPENVCVSTTTYRRTVTLPKIAGGYVLAYQRCCRNQTINNIVSPNNTGATFSVRITEKALTECNSNAKFKSWPPIFICVNEPIHFDQSAIDSEGDSIVYRLCTPLAAGDSLSNRPQPPLGPPYDTVVWTSPTYSNNNILGFGEPLRINPRTGIITGRPTMKGQYVVGICIEEYRNGEMISTTRRDFQYNVGDCGVTEAAFQIPEVQCEDLTVHFENTSSFAEDFIWFFNDPGNPGASSTELNPSYTFSDTGRYEVMLVTAPNSACSDTSYRTIYLKNSTLAPGIEYSLTNCAENSVTLNLTDASVDSFSEPDSWLWELSDGRSSTDQNPSFSIPKSKDMTLKLIVTSSDGCSETTDRVIPGSASSTPVIDLAADTTVCTGSLTIVAGDNPDLQYSWFGDSDFSQLISNTAELNISVAGEHTYHLRATNEIGCSATESITVRVSSISPLSLPRDTIICGQDIELSAGNRPGLQFVWANERDFSQILSNTNLLDVNNGQGIEQYFVRTSNSLGCSRIDSISVQYSTVPVFSLPGDTTVCGQTLSLSAGNDKNLRYSWSTDRNFGSILSDQANISISPSGNQRYYVQAENSLGCSRIDSVIVKGNILTADLADAVFLCKDEQRTIALSNLNPASELTFRWSPAQDIVTGVNTANPVFQPASTGNRTIKVNISDNFGCSIERSVDITVLETNPADMQISPQGCEDFSFNFEFPSFNAAYYTWDFGDVNNAGETARGSSVSYTYPAPGTYTVKLIPNEEIDCGLAPISKEVTVRESLRDLDFEWSYQACQNDAIIAFNNTSKNFQGNIVSWEWAFGTGVTSNQVSPVILIPETTDLSVQLTMNTDDGCSKTFARNIQVDVVNLSLPSTIVNCEGTPTTLNPGADPGYSYQWTPDAGLDDPAAPNPVANPTENTNYSVTVTNGACQITGQVNLLVTAVNSTQLADSVVVCNSNGVPLNLGVAENANISYSWSPTIGLDDATAANPVASPASTTVYTAIVRDNTNNCEVSRLIKAVVPEQELIADFSIDYQECLDSAVVELKDASLNSTGTIVSWNWQFSNGQSSDQPNAIIKLDAAETLGVNLTVTTDKGCTDRKSQDIDIQLLDVDLPQNLYVCPGAEVNLNPNGNSNYEYQWMPIGGGTLSDPTAVSPLASPNFTTEYLVTIRSQALNCQTQRKVLATVPDYDASVDFDWKYESCGEEATLAFEDQSSNSELDIKDWLWTFGNGQQSTLQNPTLAVQSDQLLDVNLMVTFEDGCTQVLAGTRQIAIELMDLDLGNELMICKGASVDLNENGNRAYKYSWAPASSLNATNVANPAASPVNSTNYTVTVTDTRDNGTCQIERSIQVNVAPDINLSVNSTDTTSCESEVLLLAKTATEASFQWSEDPGFSNVQGIEKEFLAFPGRPSIYYVRATDQFGCSETDTVSATSYALQYEIENPGSVCIGDTVSLSVVNLNEEDELLFTWSPDLEIISGENNNEIRVSPTNDVTYMVDFENQFGCSIQLALDLPVVDLSHELTLNAEPTAVIPGQQVQLNVTDRPGFSFSWIPPGLVTNSTIANPKATITENTTFAVIVEDENGCLGQGLITVNLLDATCDEPYIFVPKAFSPNGDGKNDVLMVRGNPIDEVEFVIYDRWGERIFATKDKNIGWDGTYRGKELNPDVFGYFLRIKCYDGEEYFRKGNVTLIK